jgi:hypothetical protein
MKKWLDALIVAIFVAYCMVWASVAMAHQAPSGWSYSPECCSNKDCAEISTDYVTITERGYEVRIPIGGHPMVTLEPFFQVIRPTATGLRESPDGKYHICISQQHMGTGMTFGGTMLCFYVPPMGS